MNINRRQILSVVFILSTLGALVWVGGCYITHVEPLHVDLTVQFQTTSEVPEFFPLQILLRTSALANASWRQLITNPEFDYEIMSFSRGIRFNVTNPQPNALYTLTFVHLTADSNFTNYWTPSIRTNIPLAISYILVGMFQFNLRYGGIITVDNEWGRMVRFEPEYDRPVIGRHFDEITFIHWWILVILSILVLFFFIVSVFKLNICNHDQVQQTFQYFPIVSFLIILFNLVVYAFFGGTGLPEGTPVHDQSGYSISPAGLYWGLHPLAQLGSVFLHSDYFHVTGNVLGIIIIGVFLTEGWIDLERKYILLAYSLPLFTIFRAFLFGGPYSIGASHSLAIIVSFGFVWLLFENKTTVFVLETS
ncbi:MAG: hypothetical protein ACFFDP_07710, partial [Promethearchaeota archaeon]